MVSWATRSRVRVALDSGDCVANIVLIYGDYALPREILHLNPAGHELTEHILKLAVISRKSCTTSL